MKGVKKALRLAAGKVVPRRATSPAGHASRPAGEGAPGVDGRLATGELAPAAAGDAQAGVVLMLSEVGEILAAAGPCAAVFHCEPSVLVGQNVCVFLKGGLDNEIGHALYGHRAGKPPPERAPFRLTALRRTGTEFAAAFVTVEWKLDPVGSVGCEIPRLRWSLEVRELKPEPLSPPPVVTELAAAAQLEKPAHELSPSEAIWREKLEEAKQRQARAEAARDEARAENQRLAEELAALRQEAEELRNQSRSDRLACAEHKVRADKLEKQLQQFTEEAELGHGPAERRPDWGSDEADLRARLASAKEAMDYAEAALKEEVARREKVEERLRTLSVSLKAEQAERSKRFEQELISLRQERDELNSRLQQEQESTAESRQRAEELNSRLARNAIEFQRAMAELDKQTSERQRSESQWKEQLDTAWIAKKEIEGQFAGVVERNKHFEAELAVLRKERDELIAKLTSEQLLESSQHTQDLESRLDRNARERTRIELEQQASERAYLEAEGPAPLRPAHGRKEKLEQALAEAQQRVRALEEERAKLRHERDQAARQLEEFKARHAAAERAATEAQARVKRLEEERATLQKRGDDLSARLAAEQKNALELGRRVEESRMQRGRESAEVEQLKAELKREVAERERAAAKTVEQLETLRAEKKEVETAWASALDRNVQFEEELAALRQDRDELGARCKAEQQAALEARRRADENENRCARLATELDRFRGARQHKSSERDRAEAAWAEQLNAAKALTRKLETAWNGAVERSRSLEEELRLLRQEQDRVEAKLAAEQQVAAALRERVRALENRLKEKAAEPGPTFARAAQEKQSAATPAAPGAPHAVPPPAAKRVATGRGPLLPRKLGTPPAPGADQYNLKP